jgi:general secretion pathway protein C
MHFSQFFLQGPKKLAAMSICAVSFFCIVLEIGSIFHLKALHYQPAPPQKAQRKNAIITKASPVFAVSLFGVYVPVNLSDIKKSQLDLKVVGILYSPILEDSAVMIAATGTLEHSYKVGDTLPGGATIKKISASNVIILHNGALESLSLPKNPLHLEAPPKSLWKE